MPEPRLPMRKVRDVLRLSAAGLSKRKIAASRLPRHDARGDRSIERRGDDGAVVRRRGEWIATSASSTGNGFMNDLHPMLYG